MKKLNTLKVYSLALMAGLAFVSCSDDDDDILGNWVERSVFDGTPRSGAVSFMIDGTGYVGTGYDGDDYLSDFWEYNVEGDYWQQRADFIGSARSAAVGFSVDSKGFIGSGYDGIDELGDFFSYDPSANSWTQVADFPENPRRGAIAFSGDSYAYFGTGDDGDNDRKDFWRYDPSADSWEEIYGFGGNKRTEATSFRIDDVVYMGTGESNGSYLEDFWAFDLSDESWTKLNDLDEEDDYDVVRSNATAFTLGQYGYVACGYYGGNMDSVWEYDPSTDTWEEKTDYEGVTRLDPVSLSNGTNGFVLLGRNGTSYLDDMMEFYPFDEYDDED
ncbi:Kelch repeat-containing protein [Pustulibacterium marinum]|nr:kelch repeat-containing protein [Pustulibacterium marinum]